MTSSNNQAMFSVSREGDRTVAAAAAYRHQAVRQKQSQEPQSELFSPLLLSLSNSPPQCPQSSSVFIFTILHHIVKVFNQCNGQVGNTHLKYFRKKNRWISLPRTELMSVTSRYSKQSWTALSDLVSAPVVSVAAIPAAQPFLRGVSISMLRKWVTNKI